MQESHNIFRTGKYHRSFDKKNIHPVRRSLLSFFYHTSFHLIAMLGWPDPLAKKAPQILLCGTASPYTTITFARFVSKRSNAAHIDVLDISPHALSQSESLLKTYHDIDRSKICFVEGDALHIPLPGERFDWIETDFFMQYFSTAEKATLFQEWHRVLKPGGIITTRDWLLQKQNFSERVVDRTKNWLIKHVLGPTARSAKLREVWQLLNDAGFEVAFFPVKAPFVRMRIPLMSYIIIYKPASLSNANESRHQLATAGDASVPSAHPHPPPPLQNTNLTLFKQTSLQTPVPILDKHEAPSA